MDSFDYDEIVETVLELIEETGRSITLYKLSATAADAGKPWRGPGAPVKDAGVVTKGTFVVPQTSIPTESRGLGFDWIDEELLKRSREVVLVPGSAGADLEDCNLIVDGSLQFKIIWGQCLRPGSTRLLYVFGLAK